jgi:hypothetical protein
VSRATPTATRPPAQRPAATRNGAAGGGGGAGPGGGAGGGRGGRGGGPGRARAAQATAVVAGLLAWAVLASAASPGFALPRLPAAVARALGRQPAAPPGPGPDPAQPGDASPHALADIPRAYLAHYLAAAPTCPRLSWQVLAGIGKVESDHGRSDAPGVRTGLNRAGCCAGPMQFNLVNGPPSTWDAFGRGGSPYDPGDAVPAAARKLCANGLAQPPAAARDPCPHVLGSAALHLALKRYNNACWYVHQVVTLARRYAASVAAVAPSRDPFVLALVRNPRLTTTRSHGCDPGPDLASGRLDLRVESLLAAITDRYAVRVSCLRSGHSRYVKGTRRVSNHAVWRAVDLDRVDGQPVGPTSPAARALAGWLDRLDGPLRPAEVGSPWPIGHRPYFTDEGHQHHLHVGYSADQTAT